MVTTILNYFSALFDGGETDDDHGVFKCDGGDGLLDVPMDLLNLLLLLLLAEGSLLVKDSHLQRKTRERFIRRKRMLTSIRG